MKKLSALILAAVMLLSVVSCAGNGKDTDGSETQTTTAAQTTAEETTAADTTETEPQTQTESQTTAQDEETINEEIPFEVILKEYDYSAKDLVIPADSTVRDDAFALSMLELATASDVDEVYKSQFFSMYGFDVIFEHGYDKPSTDASHTCAFSVAHKKQNVNGTERDIIAISIRGTNGAEWKSNFDVSPDKKPNPDYSENFMACAVDVLDNTKDILKNYEKPILLVTGHSRGAAAANLLGVLLYDLYPVSDVYTYTFATPATVLGAEKKEYKNIFNYINPLDLVTEVPPKSWGFYRAGTDIILENKAFDASKTKAVITALSSLADSVDSYYNKKIKINNTVSMTTFEIITGVCGLVGFLPLDASFLSAVASMTEDSPFMPVLSSLNISELMSIFDQHYPQVYMELIGK